MIEFAAKAPTIPIPCSKLLKVVALVDGEDPQTRQLLDHIAAEHFEIEVSEVLPIGVVVPGERWDDGARPMLDYFLAFQESFNRFPGFNYEVQGVYQERVDGRIKSHSYVVREAISGKRAEKGGRRGRT